MKVPWKTAWIIGASSGIGRQLSIDLSNAGVQVAVSARSHSKLLELRKKSKLLIPFQVDISDCDAMSDINNKIEMKLGVVDLVVVCAAVWHPMSAKDFDILKAKQSFEINVGGVYNVLGSVLPQFIERGKGHIAVVASVAGYRGLPNASVYGSTKAALINLAESLYPDLARYGVKLSIVNFGFVDTRMTKGNDFPMPFIMKPEKASERIISGLRKSKFEIAFPWRFVLFLKLARILPYPMYFWFVDNFIIRKLKK
ncbi:MAG: putative oxidoreductase [Hyphomicrobiaceae bacterium hypho_1]